MGMAIFLTAAGIEAVLTVFSIASKSVNQKARDFIRIAELLVFLLLTAASLIEWSFRYYSLAAGLLILAIPAATRRIRKKDRGTTFRVSKAVLKSLGIILLLFLFTLPALLFPQYQRIGTTGEYRVATAIYTYTDSSRTESYANNGSFRKLNVEFWYPETAGSKFPLVIFSHGATGIRTSNESLFQKLASHGYVVCSIDHTYHSLFTTDTTGRTVFIDPTYMKELQAEDAKTDRQQSFSYYQKWMKIRTADMNFVLDQIAAETVKPVQDKPYQLADIQNIGVMGHSLGGSAALGLGRTGQNVRAVAALESPFLCDVEDIVNGEFVFNTAPYPVPLLSVYSDSAWGHLNDWPQYAENAALLQSHGADTFNVRISGVGHFTLTDLALVTPFLTRVLNGMPSSADARTCLKTINTLCLEFFDCYLKGTGSFAPRETY